MWRWSQNMEHAAWLVLYKPLLFVIAIAAVFQGIRDLRDASRYRRPVVMTCSQFMQQPARPGWYRITECEVDLASAAYDVRDNTTVTKAYASVYPVNEEPTSRIQLLVETDRDTDLVWIQNQRTAEARNNSKQQRQWLAQHRARLHPVRTLDGFVRTDDIPLRMESLSSGLAPGAALIEEGSHPSHWWGATWLILGLAFSLGIGSGWWKWVALCAERWRLHRRMKAGVRAPAPTPGLLIRAADSAHEHLVRGTPVTVPESHIGVVVRGGYLYDQLGPGTHPISAQTFPILASHLPEDVWEDPAIGAVLVLVRSGTVEWAWHGDTARKTHWTEEFGTVRGVATLEITEPFKLLGGILNLIRREHWDAATRDSPGLVFWGLTGNRRACSALPSCGDEVLARYISQFVLARVGTELTLAPADSVISEKLSEQGRQAIVEALQNLGATCTSLKLLPVSDWKPVCCSRCGSTAVGVRNAYFLASAGAILFAWTAFKQGYFCRICGTRLGCSAILRTCASAWLNPYALLIGVVAVFRNTLEVIRFWTPNAHDVRQ